MACTKAARGTVLSFKTQDGLVLKTAGSSD